MRKGPLATQALLLRGFDPESTITRPISPRESRRTRIRIYTFSPPTASPPKTSRGRWPIWPRSRWAASRHPRSSPSRSRNCGSRWTVAGKFSLNSTRDNRREMARAPRGLITRPCFHFKIIKIQVEDAVSGRGSYFSPGHQLLGRGALRRAGFCSCGPVIRMHGERRWYHCAHVAMLLANALHVPRTTCSGWSCSTQCLASHVTWRT